jgi:hypothetical protein
MSEETKPIDKKKALEEKKAADRAAKLAKTLERLREMEEVTQAYENSADANAERKELNKSGVDTDSTFNLKRVANRAITKERLDERDQERDQERAKAEEERAALQKEGDDYVSRKNQEKEQQQKEEEDMNWTYVGGDKDSANQRFRTIDKTSMEEVEDTKVIEKKFNDGVSTGKTDKEVYESDPGLKDKYPNLGEFRKAAEAFRASQNTTETVTSKKLVPVTKQETITQDREDFKKTNHWSSKFNPASISRMSRKLKERGADVSPDELEKVFKNMGSEKDAIKWARENGYDFLVGRGGSSGSTTTRGKTDWS